MSHKPSSKDSYSIPLPEGFQESVLLVDDEVELTEVLKEMTEELGLPVYTAQSAIEALEKISTYNPFLIISDFRMPGMTGLQFCQTAKQNGYRGFFALLTGFADKKIAIEGISLGVDELMEKPIDLEIVNSCISKFARKRIAEFLKERKETDDITDLFVDESRDLLSDLDSLLLQLEETPPDPLVIDLVFRKIHSVKGGASAIAAGQHLALLTHHFESVLSRIKKENWQPQAGSLNLFLEAADLCRELLSLIQKRTLPDTPTQRAVEACSAKLEKLRTETKTPAEATSAPGEIGTVKKNSLSPETNKSSEEDAGVFVTNEKLDGLNQISSEMFVLKNTITMALQDPEIRSNAVKFNQKLHDFLYAFNKVTDALEDQVRSVRKISLHRALTKLPRLVRQTAQEVGKKIHLDTLGFELGVDRNIASALSACLTHMVRNSVDHGIEAPEIRLQNGKEATGHMSIQAFEKQGVIHIFVKDDGGGIDSAKVKNKAVEKLLISKEQAESMSEAEALNLIFLPGFSTADSVSNVSGRGVGMDVVRTAVLSLNGRIQIESQKQKGTQFHIQIPVPQTVLVEKSLLVSSRGVLVAIPLQSISRIVQSCDLRTTKVGSQWTFQHDNRTVRLVSHESLLPNDPLLPFDRNTKCSVVVLREKDQHLGFMAEQVFGQLDAVISPFDSIIPGVPGFRGTTLLGDDRVAYVLSPPEIFRLTAQIPNNSQAA